jgi:hypothetical protein
MLIDSAVPQFGVAAGVRLNRSDGDGLTALAAAVRRVLDWAPGQLALPVTAPQ